MTKGQVALDARATELRKEPDRLSDLLVVS